MNPYLLYPHFLKLEERFGTVLLQSPQPRWKDLLLDDEEDR